MEQPLPNFFVVGAVKAGTTALHLFLDQHPQVYMSPVKETNFFSQADMKAEHFNRDYRHDVRFNLEEYLSGPMDRKIHIANVERWEDYRRLFRDAAGHRAIGEASNSYLLCPSSAAALAARFPQARILMMLRNPVERVWSQYMMNLRLGKTLRQDLIGEFEADSALPVQGWGVSHNYRELGMYAGQLERYYQHFARENVHVLLYDDYRADPAGTLRAIFSFLGVDPNVPLDLDQRPNEAALPRFKKLNYLLFQSGLVNAVKTWVPDSWKGAAKQAMFSNKDMPSMTAQERSYMLEVYRSDVQRLGELLGRDLSGWLR